MDHDLDKVLEGWEGVRLQLGIPEVVRVELNDVELPLRNNVDLAHCDVRLRTSEAIAWEQLLRPVEVSRRSEGFNKSTPVFSVFVAHHGLMLSFLCKSRA